MEQLSDLLDQVRQVSLSLDALKASYGASPVGLDVRSLIQQIDQTVGLFHSNIVAGDVDKTLNSARKISIYGQQLGRGGQLSEHEHVRRASEGLLRASDALQGFAESSPLALRAINESEPMKIGELVRSNSVEMEKLIAQVSQFEKHDERVKKQLNENEVRIAELESRIKQVENDAHQEIQKIADAYVEAMATIDGKKTEIDDILGHVSGRAIAGDYQKSASDEKVMADWLRLGALFCMVCIVGVLFSAVVATVDSTFELDRFLSRVSLVFLLSVPAAYLARESAKHREQQYQHLQTSLDMKAVSPFLASLPEDERHKLKSAIAARIFGGKDFSKVGTDPYPINTHELLMEMIKRFEISTKSQQSEKAQQRE